MAESPGLPVCVLRLACLAVSGRLFTMLKWSGAAWLIWLGISLWRAGGRVDLPRAAARADGGMFPGARAETVPTPGSLVFFLAVALLDALGWAAPGGRALRAVATPCTLRGLHRPDGGARIGAGVLSARAA